MCVPSEGVIAEIPGWLGAFETEAGGYSALTHCIGESPKGGHAIRESAPLKRMSERSRKATAVQYFASKDPPRVAHNRLGIEDRQPRTKASGVDQACVRQNLVVNS